jgi:hypothetical protein
MLFFADDQGTVRNNNRTYNNSRRSGEAFGEWPVRDSLLQTASGNRRHYRNSITVPDCGGFFLQVADVFVIQVDIHKRAQFAVFGVKMPPQVRVFRNQSGQGLGDGPSVNLDRRLLTGVLAQRGGYLNFAHSLKRCRDAACGFSLWGPPGMPPPKRDLQGQRKPPEIAVLIDLSVV